MALMVNKRAKKIEMVKEAVKMVKVQRTGQGSYSGDDKEAGKTSLTVRQGAEVEVSLKKAMQLVRDFPDDWNVLSAEDEDSMQQLIKALAEGQVRTQKLRTGTAARRNAVVESTQKIVKKTLSDDFVKAINTGRVKIQEITTKELLDTVKHPGYLGLKAYDYVLSKKEENEIGGNHMSNVRYVLVKKKSEPAKEPKKDKAPEDSTSTDSVEEGPGPQPMQSKDFDIDEVPGVKHFDNPDSD